MDPVRVDEAPVGVDVVEHRVPGRHQHVRRAVGLHVLADRAFTLLRRVKDVDLQRRSDGRRERDELPGNERRRVAVHRHHRTFGGNEHRRRRVDRVQREVAGALAEQVVERLAAAVRHEPVDGGHSLLDTGDDRVAGAQRRVARMGRRDVGHRMPRRRGHAVGPVASPTFASAVDRAFAPPPELRAAITPPPSPGAWSDVSPSRRRTRRWRTPRCRA